MKAAIILVATVIAVLGVGYTTGHLDVIRPVGQTAAPSDTLWPDRFGFGQPASDQDIAKWDIDVMPDGTGLPSGRGTVAEGKDVYARKCAACHGVTGREGPDDRLVGRLPGDEFPFSEADSLRAMKTIGSYWPYPTTLFDYIRRAMPFDRPGSLTDDEVYSVTAFLLHANEIIPEDAVMDARMLPQVAMPARDRFVPDNRPEYDRVH